MTAPRPKRSKVERDRDLARGRLRAARIACDKLRAELEMRKDERQLVLAEVAMLIMYAPRVRDYAHVPTMMHRLKMLMEDK